MGSAGVEVEAEAEAAAWSSEGLIYVNGIRHVISDGLAHLTLLRYLRDKGLTGTKLGCGEGGCGACTVMVSDYAEHSKRTAHYAINACLAPLYSVEGMHIITVEGIGNVRRGLHPIQEALVRSHGTQCGFCTPGFVMSMYALLRSSKIPPTEEQIEESLCGNLCRCTGYRSILEAFRVFAKTDDSLYAESSSSSKTTNNNICPSSGLPCSCGSSDAACDEGSSDCRRFSFSQIGESFDGEKELIFPPELVLRKRSPLNLCGFGGMKWYRPLMLQHALNLKSLYPSSKLVVGNSEVGIEMKFKNAQYHVLISLTHVPELNNWSAKENGLEVGAAVRLSLLQQILKGVIAERDAYETSSCKAILEQLKWFAGKQIKNVACIGGNICTASPISDLNPLWMAAGAEFRIIDCKGKVRTALAKDFFISYRQVGMENNEMLLSVFLPWTRSFEFVKEFKQAHRKDDDIALVNAGMRVLLEGGCRKWSVTEASIVFGGVAPVSLAASKTEGFLLGKCWNRTLLEDSLEVLKEDIPLRQEAPGGMVEFRKSLTLSFFFKFFLWVSQQITESGFLLEGFNANDRSAAQPYSRSHSSGSQGYELVRQGTAVGLPEFHLSSKLQVTGEAEYVDDLPEPQNGLHAALVLSKKAHARILSIDDSLAKSSPGFVGLFLSRDVPGSNKIRPITHEEEVFASEVVTCVGQIIGVVVADTHENAKLAARKVQVEYEERPPILSIRDALKSGSFHADAEHSLVKGHVEWCFSICDRILEGEAQIGSQEHFYLEPQGTLVWPTDGGHEFHVIAASQAPNTNQQCVACVLNLQRSKVVSKTKRLGGGFGGKESRGSLLSCAAAVPAYLLRRPVKLILDRDADMLTTGHRHSFLGKYKVGFTNEGKLLALDLEIYSNGGNTMDLSESVLEAALFSCDNVYDIPHIRVIGKVCFTNLSSNTAFRGFGAPQAMFIAENWIQRIAMELQRSPEEIREINFQKDGYITHYGQQLQNCTLSRLWDELKASCEFSKAREVVDEFNLHNRWRKRGVAMVPTKLGIGFSLKLLNQAGALVQIYLDGTVLVSHGGVEMGQGLHTKVAQVAATAFNIPLSAVFVSETSTDKVPNATSTAASASSDVYGAAVLDACDQLKARMKPISDRNKHSSFTELVQACYAERISLSAHGFYVTPDLSFDWGVGKGNIFSYYTYGAAFAEVEIDTLTGDFYTRTVDCIMDLGRSLNPAIDIGQIEGAFVQGLGYFALEELKWGDADHKWIAPGDLYTCGPGTYKIPSVNDIPFKFKVSLLKGAANPKAIHSSKGVGEPPLFLASSVFFAIKDAIMAARAEEGYSEWFCLDSPATPERIRMACVDDFTRSFAGPDYHPKISV